MNQTILLAIIGILPAILSSIVTYQLAVRKLKYNSESDLRSDFTKLSESLRLELKKELDNVSSFVIYCLCSISSSCGVSLPAV